jgi:serine/threonine protein kinase
MGEVYRARDSRLERIVAIKVLPEHLAASPEVHQRFEREARVISSLSHPHICTLYDIGEDEGTHYLVMEYLEGETLAARLERGPLPIDEVLSMGIQIADALDRAHRSGVVHRDLKPGNVMLTAAGVKLLDFGLAKLHLSASPDGGTDLSRMLTEQPASAPLTVEGTILGTFQYMAPEQLEGREVDARSDLFALGTLLHEMATGRKAFTGATQASLIGSIMQSSPPPVSSLSELAPPAFDRVVQACLAKSPEDRWQTAHDVKLQLQWIAEGGSQIGLPAPVAARRKTRERLAWSVAAVAMLAAVAFALGFVRRAPTSPEPMRFEIQHPSTQRQVDSPKLSPDGRYLAYGATDDQARTMVWLRPMASLDALPLAGTEGLQGRPFWSPDGRHLAFFAEGKLKKVPVTGGPAQTICDAPRGADGTWSEDGVILFDGQDQDPILRVAAAGGVATPLIVPEGDDQVGWPQFLPGGDRFLFVVFGGGEQRVQVADADGSNVRTVLAGQSRVEYSPPGYLLYVREQTLVAHPFDSLSAELSGEPVPLTEGLEISFVGLSHFSASRSGALAFRTGAIRDGLLQWVDLDGRTSLAVEESGGYEDPALSPDGRWIAFELPGQEGDDLWIHDLRRGTTSRFTYAPGDDADPIWSPDGRRIAYGAWNPATKSQDLAVKTVSGGGEPEVLLERDGVETPLSWSPDGRSLLFQTGTAATRGDVWLLSLDDGEASPLLATQFMEQRGRFSPDGRWVAYEGHESGRPEIYVQAFPGPVGKWQVSTDGGNEPQWSPDGRTIFYLALDGRLTRVAVEAGRSDPEGFEAGVPESLFPLRLTQAGNRTRFVVTPDGERLLALAPNSEEVVPPTTLILHWAAALSR